MLDMEFCHIHPDDPNNPAYCGIPSESSVWTCEDFDGEAVCPTCGLPTCPRCAQIAALEEGVEA